MSDQKTVLVIAPFFIPRRRVGALRPFKFAIHLSKYGYKPIILTIGFRPDSLTPKEKELMQSIEVLSINTPFDRTSDKSNGENSVNQKLSVIREFILNWFDSQCPVDTWILLFFLRWSRIKRAVKQSNPDLIFATGDPWSSLWLGEKLSKLLNKPFVADFRDPWTLGEVNLRKRSAISARIDSMIEKRVVQNADRLIFTTEQTSRTYSDYYQTDSRKTGTIYNSFEPGLMSMNDQGLDYPDMDKTKVNILFFGRFRRLSSVAGIVEILRQAGDIEPDLKKYVKIHSFGKPDKEELNLIVEAGLESMFSFHVPIEPERSLSVLNRADLLLLSTSNQRSQIIPAKMWDYLFSETPILSIVPNPEVGEIIETYQAGIHFPPDKRTEIAELLVRVIENKRSGTEMPQPLSRSTTDLKVFTSEETTRQLSAIFDDVIG